VHARAEASAGVSNGGGAAGGIVGRRGFRLDYCTLCGLGSADTVVPGEKHFVRAHPRIFFLGEAPGRDEDRIGRPFVGRAGQLLRRCMEEAGIKSYYISNVCFCRPPDNRNPTPQEMATCGHYTLLELTTMRPHLVVALGKIATDFLKNFDVARNCTYANLRGRNAWSIYNPITGKNILIKTIFHPAYILRNKKELAEYQQNFYEIIEIAQNCMEEKCKKD
jgi:DNA polymerase